jgi:acetyl-CoA C-acetyltransferase
MIRLLASVITRPLEPVTVGATGVRQVVDAYQQLTNQAGARQINGVKKFLTFNMGGSLTTSVAMIWGTD